MILWLDDLRSPPEDGWVWVKSYKEAIDAIIREFPDFISFDHDLGEAKSGLDVAHFLINIDIETGAMPLWFDFQVHSANPVGRDNIQGLLKRYMEYKAMPFLRGNGYRN
jgi:hypothetical protein